MLFYVYYAHLKNDFILMSPPSVNVSEMHALLPCHEWLECSLISPSDNCRYCTYKKTSNVVTDQQRQQKICNATYTRCM